MATPNRFSLKWFSNDNNTESESRPSSGDARTLKSAGPQTGDSAGDCEGQARIQIGENVAFD